MSRRAGSNNETTAPRGGRLFLKSSPSAACAVVLHALAELLRQVEAMRRENKSENAVPDIFHAQMRLREANLKGFSLSQGKIRSTKQSLKLYFSNIPLDLLTLNGLFSQ